LKFKEKLNLRGIAGASLIVTGVLLSVLTSVKL
jgi:drug/metabolite transporter (DMT)-like permease